MTDTRRTILALAGAAAVLPFGHRRARAAGAPVCYDTDALPLSQKSRRRSVSYVARSTDPARHCSVCSFFTASDGDCGTCAILGGPVTAGAVCNSFAVKSGK